MRFVLAMLAVTVFAGLCSGQQRSVGWADGKPICVVITAEQLRATRWQETENEPPISIGTAIKWAKKSVHERYPECQKLGSIVSVEFKSESFPVNDENHFTDLEGREYVRNEIERRYFRDGWVYWVRVQSIPTDGMTGIRYSIPVAVLMNGTTIVPTEITRSTNDAAFKSQFRLSFDPTRRGNGQ